MISERVLTRWRRLVAFMKAIGWCAWYITGAPPWPSNGQQSGHILHRHFVFCRPGGRRGDIEWVVAQWRCLVAFMKALDNSSIGQCARYRTIALQWLSKWPATEVHSFVVAASFVWSNVAKRPCYGPFELTPSYYINIIGVISLCVYFWPPLPTMDAVSATIVAGGQAQFQ
jgi:hypothetical protein